MPPNALVAKWVSCALESRANQSALILVVPEGGRHPLPSIWLGVPHASTENLAMLIDRSRRSRGRRMGACATHRPNRSRSVDDRAALPLVIDDDQAHLAPQRGLSPRGLGGAISVRRRRRGWRRRHRAIRPPRSPWGVVCGGPEELVDDSPPRPLAGSPFRAGSWRHACPALPGSLPGLSGEQASLALLVVSDNVTVEGGDERLRADPCGLCQVIRCRQHCVRPSSGTERCVPSHPQGRASLRHVIDVAELEEATATSCAT